mmetsp:Transcript_41613/g.107672  ORF Transcript_41613/g.107672 Transcript_41613/m.107672 type:complete len:92 (+) Transcript_41613:191-466(+)
MGLIRLLKSIKKTIENEGTVSDLESDIQDLKEEYEELDDKRKKRGHAIRKMTRALENEIDKLRRKSVFSIGRALLSFLNPLDDVIEVAEML